MVLTAVAVGGAAVADAMGVQFGSDATGLITIVAVGGVGVIEGADVLVGSVDNAVGRNRVVYGSGVQFGSVPRIWMVGVTLTSEGVGDGVNVSDGVSVGAAVSVGDDVALGRAVAEAVKRASGVAAFPMMTIVAVGPALVGTLVLVGGTGVTVVELVAVGDGPAV